MWKCSHRDNCKDQTRFNVRLYCVAYENEMGEELAPRSKGVASYACCASCIADAEWEDNIGKRSFQV